jgi:hypothetical protein
MVKQYYDYAIHNPEYKTWSDADKAKHLKQVFTETRNDFRAEFKARAFWQKYKGSSREEQQRMMQVVESNIDKLDDDLYQALLDFRP